ncbi:MAG TPA: asparagine synthase-related protein, partial [Thermoanaerobaculia bacterium]|nr:asparagine synthase-related protein [Thermoanaerobaculia bacterium]
RDIRALPAGHAMIASAKGIRVTRWWDLPIEEPLHLRDPREYVDGFREVLERAVADRVTSDRIAISMSGGLDSSSIAALAAPKAHVTAFTNVFEPLVPDDERRFALSTASHLGIDIQIIEAANVRLFEKWDRPEYQKEEPCNDPLSSITTDAFRRASQLAPVMLSGQGGDAVLYASHSYFFNLLRGGRFLRFASEVAGHLATKHRLPPLCLRSSFRRALGRRAPRPDYPNWIAPDLEKKLDLRARWDAYWDDEPEIHPTRPQAFNLLRGIGWQRLHEYVDAEAMGAPIEYRNPLLDVRVVRYLLRVPPMPWFAEKEILRAAMKGMLPEDVRLRRKKAIPIDPSHLWLDRQADALCRAIAAMDDLDAWVQRDRVIAAIRNPARSNYDSFLLVLPLSLGLWIAAKVQQTAVSSIICKELSV